MIIKNYYKILGVEYSATDAEIKAAHRRLVKKYHPDLNQGDADAAAKFRNVQEAGEALMNAEKRVEHDYLLESKGVHTGRFDHFDEGVEDEPLPEPEPAAPAQAKPAAQKPDSKTGKENIKAGAQKKTVPPRRMTLAEKAAAAMAKVREAKRATRRAVIIAVSVIAAAALIGVAVWLAFTFGGEKYAVTFEYGNGQPSAVQEVDPGGSVAKPETDPAREGYRFLGWFDAPTGGNRIDLSSFTPSGDMTLYAQWKLIEYTNITFVYDDGKTPNATMSVEIGGREWAGYGVGGITRPLRGIGYDFMGWYFTDAGGTEKMLIQPDENVRQSFEKDMTLTAKWSVWDVNVLLTWNDGGNDKLETHKYDETQGKEFGLPDGAAAAGFLGWYDEKAERLVTDEAGKLLDDFAVLYPSYNKELITLVARYEGEEE